MSEQKQQEQQEQQEQGIQISMQELLDSQNIAINEMNKWNRVLVALQKSAMMLNAIMNSQKQPLEDKNKPELKEDKE